MSVVIPCLNAAGTLSDQLEALARQTYADGWQLIVADNGSSDGSPDIARGYADRIDLTVIDVRDRRSPAYARNRAAIACQGDWLVFVDADDIVAPTFLEAMADALSRYEVVSAQAEVARLNKPWARVRQEFHTALRLPFPPHLPFGSSFGLGVRRALHEAVGGFDEDVRGIEDVDYTIRLQLAGAALHHEPRAIVHYRYRDTIAGIFLQAALYAEGFAQLEKRYRTARVGPLVTWPLRGWKGIAAVLPRIGGRAGRAELAWLAGWQLGRLRGSMRHGIAAG